jgi:hypothetical protein
LKEEPFGWEAMMVDSGRTEPSSLWKRETRGATAAALLLLTTPLLSS